MVGTFSREQKRVQSLDDFLNSNDDFFANMGGEDQLPMNLKRSFFRWGGFSNWCVVFRLGLTHRPAAGVQHS